MSDWMLISQVQLMVEVEDLQEKIEQGSQPQQSNYFYYVFVYEKKIIRSYMFTWILK